VAEFNQNLNRALVLSELTPANGISLLAGCGKILRVSFRGRGLPEESAFFLGLAKKQIPRFARDDIKLLFSAAS
jgi:hypothetical protein